MRSPTALFAAAGRRLPRGPFRVVMPFGLWRRTYRFWLSVVRSDDDPRRAMRRLLVAYDDLYRELDRAAIAYDDGIHAKHRLTRYHDFFVARVRPGERVLDIGCGKGELALDLAQRGGAEVVGVDSSPEHLAFARARSAHPHVTYLEGDVLDGLPEGEFDVVVLSNVLEHFEHRVELLRRIAESASPDRVLVRVPVYARHWTIPLREELGLTYFSNATHWVEYEPDGFRGELASAGLEVTELVVTWGEIWATATPFATGAGGIGATATAATASH